MYRAMIVANSTVLYIQKVLRVDLKNTHHKGKKNTFVTMCGNGCELELSWWWPTQTAY